MSQTDPATDLRGFLQEQDSAGQVDRVDTPTSPDFELARHLHAHPHRIQLFEQVTDACRVASGLVATRSLMAAALGLGEGELIPRIASALVSREAGVTLAEADGFAARDSPPDLRRLLPAVRFYPEADQPYLTAGIIAARSHRHGMNYSFHRMMFLGENRLAVRVVPRHLNMILEEGGDQARVAVLLGVHPAVSLAAACSGPPNLDELHLAGRLLGHPIPAVDLDGLQVPAGTEIVLQGRFTGELVSEGPFVDITGTLDGVRQQPLLVIEQAYAREDPICPVILPAGTEHRLLMGLPQEPRIWNGVRATVPGLESLALTPGSCGWLHAVVAIHARSAGEGKNAGLAALAAHPSLKRVVVVDPDIDVNDPEQVEWAIATRCQPDRDLTVVTGVRGSSLDPSRDPDTELTAKWIIDATLPSGRDPADFRRIDLGDA